MLRRGDGELISPSFPNHQPLSAEVRASRSDLLADTKAEPSILDASFGRTTNERLEQTGIGCEDGK
jgi:hypothetical protein